MCPIGIHTSCVVCLGLDARTTMWQAGASRAHTGLNLSPPDACQGATRLRPRRFTPLSRGFRSLTMCKTHVVVTALLCCCANMLVLEPRSPPSRRAHLLVRKDEELTSALKRTCHHTFPPFKDAGRAPPLRSQTCHVNTPSP